MGGLVNFENEDLLVQRGDERKKAQQHLLLRCFEHQSSNSDYRY